jgi:hypothetical protein
MGSLLMRTTPPRGHRIRLALRSVPSLVAMLVLVSAGILAVALTR